MRPGREIPVLLLMDPENRDLEEMALAGGAAGVVFKPLTPAALTRSVTKILSSREQSGREVSSRSNLEEIASTLEECNDSSFGMWMGKEAFGNVYRHMLAACKGHARIHACGNHRSVQAADAAFPAQQ